MKAQSGETKSERTKKAIVDAAMELFGEVGYDQATMRAIADRAGVSTGNAYYYFASKEDLMQGFYEDLLHRFSDRVDAVLEEHRSFDARLDAVLCEWVENARPFHEFADGFFRHAADPKSPLSPFSPESKETRDASIAVMARVVDGSEKLKMSSELRPRLPELLWLYEMGIVLFWVHDQSIRQRRTITLISRTAPLVARLIGLTRLPVLRGTAADLMDLVSELQGPNETSAAIRSKPG